ncbi:MAG: hypothetical protein C4307_01620, partial [Chloroflexota bacterium]
MAAGARLVERRTGVGRGPPDGYAPRHDRGDVRPMTESIYEQYKAALRRGHLAVLRGQLDAAIEAYRAASAIVPERALPHASIGAVELRRGRPAEALAAFELALERAPNDEGA